MPPLSAGPAFVDAPSGVLVLGMEVLGEDDLEPVMARMREQLISRNVASEVANDITASVKATLLDQKLKSFTR